MGFKNVLWVTCVLMTCAGNLQAQGSTLYTNGKVRVKGGDWRDTRITVMPQFGDAFEIPLTSDQFDLDLGLLSTYLVRAAHDGCAAKEIVFDLWVPAAYRNSVFTFPYEILLESFKPNEQPYRYDHPVSGVFFDETAGAFTYTTDYSSIQKARELPTLVERMATHISLHPKPEDPMAGYIALLAHDPNAEGAQTNSNEAERAATPTVTEMSTLPPPLPKAPQPEPEPAAPPAPEPTKSPAPGTPKAPSTAERGGTRNVSSSHMTTRLAYIAPKDAHSSHELNVLPTMVVVIDRFGNASTSTEVRKVTHTYGAVFYFKDGESITERAYQEWLKKFAQPARSSN